MSKNEKLKRIKKQRKRTLMYLFFSLFGIAGGWHLCMQPGGEILQSGGICIVFGGLMALMYFYILYRVYGIKLDALREEIANGRLYRKVASKSA